MKLIGLTGSIAMGKSEVAKIFRMHAIPVFDSDAEVHKLYDSEEGAALIRRLIPEAAVHGKVDRGVINEHVLRDPALLTRLENMVHAEIKRRREAFIAKSASGLVVLDIPLLFETGSEKDVDVSLVVSSSPALQRKRAFERQGMTEDRFKMISARQMPDAEKRKRATYVIENNGTLADLQKSVEELIQRLKA